MIDFMRLGFKSSAAGSKHMKIRFEKTLECFICGFNSFGVSGDSLNNADKEKKVIKHFISHFNIFK